MLFYKNLLVGKKVKDGGLYLSGQKRKLAAKGNRSAVQHYFCFQGGCKKTVCCLLIQLKKHAAS